MAVAVLVRNLRIDIDIEYCNKNPLQINAYEHSFFTRSMNIHKKGMLLFLFIYFLCLLSAILFYLQVFYLFFSLSCCVCVVALLHSSIDCHMLLGNNVKEINALNKAVNSIN